MNEFTPVASLAGGVLIGIGSGLLLLSAGKIAGISGIVSGLLTPSSFREGSWRWAFISGMLIAALGLHQAWPAWFDLEGLPGAGGLLVAGLLVGIGTRLGGGCTSGHGVCGIGRLSPRSLVATVTFVLTGALTVFLMRRLLEVGS